MPPLLHSLAQELDYGRELLEQLYQERDNKRIFLQVSQHHMQVLQVSAAQLLVLHFHVSAAMACRCHSTTCRC
jgi:hypothetical protein